MKKNDSHHPPSEDLFAFRDGELLPEKRGIIEAHVMGCSVCRSFIDQVSSLEAELRQSPDRAPTGYFEALQDKVRARIAVAASELAAAAEAPAADRRRTPRGADAAPGRDRDDVGARRERGRVKEAPVLPWAAVLSTASAAAAVLVVVAILIKQGPYQRMVTPKAPKTESPSPGADLKREDDAGVEKKSAAGEKGIAAREKAETRPEPAPPAAKLDDARRDRLEKAADRAALKREPATEQFGALSQEEPSEKPQASAAPRSLANESQALAPAYAAVLSRFGLPPLWDDLVSPEALANAEPDFRSLYVSGGAGNDSARVRLYLAEAVRLRYAPGDSTLYDEIQRHYRRAIDLAGPDAETARVAEERLRSLEK